MKLDKKSVGNRIYNIRKEKGLTLEQFGKLIDNANKSIASKWERGDTVPSNKRLKIIAELGNVSTTYLTTGQRTISDLDGGTTKEKISNYFHDEYEEAQIQLAQDIISFTEKPLSNTQINFLSNTLKFIQESDVQSVDGLNEIIKSLNRYHNKLESNSDKEKEEIEQMINHFEELLKYHYRNEANNN